MIPYSCAISNKFMYRWSGSSIFSAGTIPIPPPGRLAKIRPKAIGINNSGSYFFLIPRKSKIPPIANISSTPGSAIMSRKAVILYKFSRIPIDHPDYLIFTNTSSSSTSTPLSKAISTICPALSALMALKVFIASM